MKVKTHKDWKKLNVAFGKWFNLQNGPTWLKQRNWLSKELVKENFIEEVHLPEMWAIFHQLTDNCSNWAFQSKILFLITLCLNKELGEDLGRRLYRLKW